MTTAGVLALLTPLAPLLAGLAALAAPSAAAADRAGRIGGSVAAVPALVLAAAAVAAGDGGVGGAWWALDPAGAVFLTVAALVGATSALLSPEFLRRGGPVGMGARAARRRYWAPFAVFWALLLLVPLLDNLGAAWVVIEATTAASALLVAFSGRRPALDAAWRYLVLTGVGLTLSLFGVIVIAVASPDPGDPRALGFGRLQAAAPLMDHRVAVVGFLLVMVGLAAKAGWAPVHHWLPGAHGEAPAPVSALLSGALLPAVALVAWRTALALEPAVGTTAIRAVFLGFGLASLVVAVPFLWRPLPWKRTLAFSSLEHMGVIALGIGFLDPIATAGVLLHVCGHAAAKALGFHASVPLLRYQPSVARRPPRAVGALGRPVGWAVGVSVGALAALPPSPLLVSEILILWGGIAAGAVAVVAVATVLLALAFVGLSVVLVEGLTGRSPGRRPRRPAALRPLGALAAVCTVVLLTLTAVAPALPGSDLVAGLAVVP